MSSYLDDEQNCIIGCKILLEMFCPCCMEAGGTISLLQKALKALNGMQEAVQNTVNPLFHFVGRTQRGPIY